MKSSRKQQNEIQAQLKNCCYNGPRKGVKKQLIKPQVNPTPIKKKIPKCTYSLPDKDFNSNPQVPIELRMAIRFNKIDRLKSCIKPQAAQRLSHFPLWNEWPLDAKIPDYRSTAWPEGSLYFTRGKLCQSLFSRRKEFDLTDPKGLQNPAPILDYTALHDPMAQGYFKNPYVVHQLQCWEMINDQNEVLCDTRNFNQYRAYLASIQNDTIEEELRRDVELYKINHDIQRVAKACAKPDCLPPDPLAGLTKARKLYANKQYRLKQASDRRRDKWEEKINTVHNHRLLRRRMAEDKIIAADNKSLLMRIRKDMAEESWRVKILTNLLQSEVRREQTATNLENQCPTKGTLKKQQEERKLLALQTRSRHELEITKNLSRERIARKREWIRDYEKHFIDVENNQDNIHAIRRAKAERVKWIRRKYFDLWRKIVLSHRERPDSPHHSLWSMGRELHYTILKLESLPELYGYDPHHNIFDSALRAGSVKNWKEKLVEEESREAAKNSLKESAEVDENENE